MNFSTRRQALGSVILMGAALTSGLGPARARALAPVTMPSGPMRLTRKLERPLSGEAMVSVERSWIVRFARQGRGIALSGEQLEAVVEAPESLASLAAIEQARQTDDMWPIMLSDEGMIVAAGRAIREEDLNSALVEAERIIAARDYTADMRQAMLQNLHAMQRAGRSLLARLPDDLFFPATGPQFSQRSIDLGGGMTGEFEVSYDAVAAGNHGWLERAERRITTRIADTERHARELWVMAEIGV